MSLNRISGNGENIHMFQLVTRRTFFIGIKSALLNLLKIELN